MQPPRPLVIHAAFNRSLRSWRARAPSIQASAAVPWLAQRGWRIPIRRTRPRVSQGARRRLLWWIVPMLGAAGAANGRGERAPRADRILSGESSSRPLYRDIDLLFPIWEPHNSTASDCASFGARLHSSALVIVLQCAALGCSQSNPTLGMHRSREVLFIVIRRTLTQQCPNRVS